MDGAATESQKPSELVTGSSTTNFIFGSAPSNGSNVKASFSFGRYALIVSIDKHCAKLQMLW
jgi:hypothetical protein